MRTIWNIFFKTASIGIGTTRVSGDTMSIILLFRATAEEQPTSLEPFILRPIFYNTTTLVRLFKP